MDEKYKKVPQWAWKAIWLVPIAGILLLILGLRPGSIPLGRKTSTNESLQNNKKAGLLKNDKNGGAPDTSTQIVKPRQGSTQPKTTQPASMLVFDQSGKPVVNARVWISDGEGKRWPVVELLGGISVSADHWSTNDVGSVCCWTYGDRKKLGEDAYMPAKTYTIHISKDNYDVIEEKVDYSISDTEKSVSFMPNKFVLRKWSTVSAVIVDSSGKPVGKPIQNVAGGASFSLVDGQGKKYGQYTTRYDISTGRLEIGPVPDGQYTLHIKSAYDYTYDGAIKIEYASMDQAASVLNSDVFLGKIILQKK